MPVYGTAPAINSSLFGTVILRLGAQFKYEETLKTIDQPDYQGCEAVNFIIEQAKLPRSSSCPAFGLRLELIDLAPQFD